MAALGLRESRSSHAKKTKARLIGELEALEARFEQLEMRVQDTVRDDKAPVDEALAESEARLRAVMDTTVDGIVVIDERGVIESFNAAAQNIFGYAAAEAIGQNVALLMPAPDTTRHDSYIANYLTTGEAKIIGFGREVTGRRKDGSAVPLDLAISETRIGGQRVFTGIVRDITDRKQADVAVRRLARQNELILNAAGDGIYGLDIDGKAVFVNSIGARMLGWEPEELIGRLLHDVVHHKHPDGTPYPMEECPTYQTLRDGKPQERRDEVFWHRDGHGIPVRYTSMPIYEYDSLVGAVLTFRDISESIEAERQLLLAKDEADAANLAKSDFLSQMSHELRTPLSAILGFGQLLASDTETALNETQSAAVQQILSSGEHLLTLINEVLDLVVIESGKVPLSMEDVEPGTVIENSLVQSEAFADTNGVRLVDRTARKDLPPVQTDATRFQQAMLNLISNAIKYNRDDGTVTVDAAKTDDGFLRISVADTGMGIPDARREDVFIPFTRLVARSSEIEGTGIGLTITKNLIELMGGRVDFESTEGEGSTFWIDLPLATGPGMGARQAEVAMISPDDEAWDAALGERTILYVEDDPANLRLLKQIMSRVPALTAIAADTAELALELADAHRPDLILMDIDLPGMDGIEALARLRQNPRTRDIPVVALSASAMPADVERGRAAGFRKYLTKPLNIAETLKTIREIIAGT